MHDVREVTVQTQCDLLAGQVGPDLHRVLGHGGGSGTVAHKVSFGVTVMLHKSMCENRQMNVRPSRMQVAAVCVACSGGAQVMAGVNGGITFWQAVWLLVTALAGGAGAWLTSGLPSKKTFVVPFSAQGQSVC